MIRKFQFTHPVWGATSAVCLPHPISASFNSRTPCGVRPERCKAMLSKEKFQFTHPVWGATRAPRTKRTTDAFQFTHPVWGATISARRLERSYVFQFTHPVWGATQQSHHFWRLDCFNSRTPCGVRRRPSLSSLRSSKFQFTHPVWGATDKNRSRFSDMRVSIHAPRVGCDKFCTREGLRQP